MYEKSIYDSEIRYHVLVVIKENFYFTIFKPRHILSIMRQRGYNFRDKEHSPQALAKTLSTLCKSDILDRVGGRGKKQGYKIGKNFQGYYDWTIKNRNKEKVEN